MNCSLLGWQRSWRPPEDASSRRETRTLILFSRSPEPFFPRSLMTAPSDANIIHHDTPQGCWWSGQGGGGGGVQRAFSWVVFAWKSSLLGLWFGLSDSDSFFLSGSSSTWITCVLSSVSAAYIPSLPSRNNYAGEGVRDGFNLWRDVLLPWARGGEEQPLFRPHVQPTPSWKNLVTHLTNPSMSHMRYYLIYSCFLLTLTSIQSVKLDSYLLRYFAFMGLNGLKAPG